MRLHAAVIAFAFFYSLSPAEPAPVYLNDDAGITLSVGAASVGGFVNVSESQSLANVIDLDSANAPDFHSQTSHVWWSGGPLELIFNLQNEYNLTTLHFWNYFTEGFDVDNIALAFFDSSNTNVGSLNVAPALGGPGTPNEMIVPQDIVLGAPANVQFVSALFTGTNNQIDFNNMGFTGELSSPGPGPGPSPVPGPGALTLLGAGLLLPLIRFVRRGSRQRGGANFIVRRTRPSVTA